MALWIEHREKGFTGNAEGVFFSNGKARVPKLKAQELLKKKMVYCDALGVHRPKTKPKKKQSSGKKKGASSTKKNSGKQSKKEKK